MIKTYQKTGLLLAAVLFSSVFALANASDIFNGREVYELHCQTCHGMDGQAMEPGTPDFSLGEGLFAPDVDLVQRLRDGGGHLPSYRGLLTDDELRDVVAYIRTLQR
jgi:mono/diheme cytochrome c family protein